MIINTYRLFQNGENLPYLAKESEHLYRDVELNSPEEITKMLNTLFNFKNLAEEYAYMLCFNTKFKLIAVFEIAHGIVNAALLRSREVYIRAAISGAACIVVAHNHPSGVSRPSQEDYEVCKNLKEAGEVMQIKLVDFLVIGETTYSVLLDKEISN